MDVVLRVFSLWTKCNLPFDQQYCKWCYALRILMVLADSCPYQQHCGTCYVYRGPIKFSHTGSSILSNWKLKRSKQELSLKTSFFVCQNTVEAQYEEVCSISILPVDEPGSEIVGLKNLLSVAYTASKNLVELGKSKGCGKPHGCARYDSARPSRRAAVQETSRCLVFESATRFLEQPRILLVQTFWTDHLEAGNTSTITFSDLTMWILELHS